MVYLLSLRLPLFFLISKRTHPDSQSVWCGNLEAANGTTGIQHVYSKESRKTLGNELAKGAAAHGIRSVKMHARPDISGKYAAAPAVVRS